MMTHHAEILDAVRRALEEDIGPGDVTTLACVPERRTATGCFLARETLVVAGTDLLPLIYQLRGGVDELRTERADGTEVNTGEKIAFVRGRARNMLECER